MNRDQERDTPAQRGGTGGAERPGAGEAVAIARDFRDGDVSATRLVRRRVHRIIGFRRYGMSPEDRRDVEQEVMTQVWQATQRLEAEVDDGFWGFVEVLTVRRCIDWLRTRRTHAPLDDSLPEGGDPLAEALERERVQLAEAALERLNEPCRRLIDLRVRENRSYREIADLLNTSEGTLRIRMHRCIKKAGEVLEQMRSAEGPTGDRVEVRS